MSKNQPIAKNFLVTIQDLPGTFTYWKKYIRAFSNKEAEDILWDKYLKINPLDLDRNNYLIISKSAESQPKPLIRLKKVTCNIPKLEKRLHLTIPIEVINVLVYKLNVVTDLPVCAVLGDTEVKGSPLFANFAGQVVPGSAHYDSQGKNILCEVDIMPTTDGKNLFVLLNAGSTWNNFVPEISFQITEGKCISVDNLDLSFIRLEKGWDLLKQENKQIDVIPMNLSDLTDNFETPSNLCIDISPPGFFDLHDVSAPTKNYISQYAEFLEDKIKEFKKSTEEKITLFEKEVSNKVPIVGKHQFLRLMMKLEGMKLIIDDFNNDIFEAMESYGDQREEPLVQESECDEKHQISINVTDKVFSEQIIFLTDAEFGKLLEIIHMINHGHNESSPTFFNSTLDSLKGKISSELFNEHFERFEKLDSSDPEAVISFLNSINIFVKPYPPPF